MGSPQATYDFENRLTHVTITGTLGRHPTTVTVDYKYDALGRRIERSPSNGDVQKFVYDGQDVVQDLDDDDNVVASYLNGPGIDNKIRQTDANGNVYFTTDHLGSTRALTDDSGSVVEQINYDSFGNTEGSSLTRYTYTGREFDSQTGLYYYRARFYDGQIGRFISEDPISLIGGINLYAYVENNPTNATDPFGLQRLAPLGPRTTTDRGISRDELNERMKPRGASALADDVMRQLDRGCIGMTACYMGKGPDGNFYDQPESAPGVRCYLEENLAKARKCGRCCRNFVFGVQGVRDKKYKGISFLPAGRVPTDYITHQINFNYVIWFPSTRRYAYMDYGNGEAGMRHAQSAFIDASPPGAPATMWCSYCKPVRR